MKRLLVLLLAGSATTALVPAEARGAATTFLWSPGHHPTDEEAIRALVSEASAAWNAGDPEKYGAHFAGAGTFTTITGMAFQGRRAFVDRHREFLTTLFKGSILAAPQAAAPGEGCGARRDRR